jgi:hypothetical protein
MREMQSIHNGCICMKASVRLIDCVKFLTAKCGRSEVAYLASGFVNVSLMSHMFTIAPSYFVQQVQTSNDLTSR